MPQHNLRVIYENLIDDPSTSLSASSTQGGTNITNLKNETKSSVWRATGNSATITVNFSGAKTIGGVILPYSSMSSTSTINVSAYTGTSGGGSLIYSTGSIFACPVSMHTEASANNYAYGTSRIARAWFDQNYNNVGSLVIILSNTTTVEVGKMVVGSFWTAVCNTKFGLGTEFGDTTTVTRLDSGDTIVRSGFRFRKMSFEMAWLLKQDRPEFRRILQRNGLKYPMFVSLFPQVAQHGTTPTDEEYDLEHTHCVYGRLTQMSQLVNSTYTVHANTIEIEEV